MRRLPTPTTSARRSTVPLPLEQAWSVVAAGQTGPRWYVDAAPFVVRGGVDRLLGGAGRRWPVPDTPLLRTGDRAGFWVVDLADHDEHRLVLQAEVRAPGAVELTTRLRATVEGCRLEQTVVFRPSGVLGAAYLVADLPAREAVVELTHRRLLADLSRAAGPPTLERRGDRPAR